MKATTRVLMILTALTLVVAPAYVLAQEGQPSAPAAKQAQGELLSVDETAKEIAIRTAAGTSMEFQYDDKTQVTGATEGPAGLATMAGSQVTVHFTSQGETNLATRIEVRAP